MIIQPALSASRPGQPRSSPSAIARPMSLLITPFSSSAAVLAAAAYFEDGETLRRGDEHLTRADERPPSEPLPGQQPAVTHNT